MKVLDQIIQLRDQGMDDEEIIQKLQEDGIPPKVINDALSNEQIKKAVSDEYEESPAPSPEADSGNQQNPKEYYQPQQQESQDYYAPQDYQQQGYEQQGLDSGTIVEIAEQVFSEKSQKMQKQIDSLMEFKSVADGKIESISERLKRIEAMIDKLQISILEKVGSYGSNLESIKKEMSMMQDTFSKVGNNQRANQRPQQEQRQQPQNSENFSRQQKQPKKFNREE